MDYATIMFNLYVDELLLALKRYELMMLCTMLLLLWLTYTLLPALNLITMLYVYDVQLCHSYVKWTMSQ